MRVHVLACTKIIILLYNETPIESAFSWNLPTFKLLLKPEPTDSSATSNLYPSWLLNSISQSANAQLITEVRPFVPLHITPTTATPIMTLIVSLCTCRLKKCSWNLDDNWNQKSSWPLQEKLFSIFLTIHIQWRTNRRSAIWTSYTATVKLLPILAHRQFAKCEYSILLFLI